MNNDLISRKALLDKIREEILEKDEIKDALDRQYNKGLLRAIQDVKRAAAVDVEPVRHGSWVWNNDAIDWNIGAWVCSECGRRNENIHAGAPGKRITLDCDPYIWAGSKYCPNCGARMDGGGGE